MIAIPLGWFEEEQPRDLIRWAAAAAIVLGVHAAAISSYLVSHQPEQIGGDDFEVAIELAPIENTSPPHDEAVETLGRVLLRRYGVVFRRLLAREEFGVSWYDLGRLYRRLEARGEIRGGYFISGVSGEQFALPEAIGLLRSLRKSKATGDLITVSAADPLNLAGILAPSPRIPAITSNRLLLVDGEWVAALQAGQVQRLHGGADVPEQAINQALKMGKLPTALRPYYA